MQKNLILGLLFAIIVAIFSIQNAVPVTISFFTYNFKTSLVVVVLGGMVFGALIMGVFGSIKQIKLKKRLRNSKREEEKLKRKNAELEQTLKDIKDTNNIKDEEDYPSEQKNNSPANDDRNENQLNS